MSETATLTDYYEELSLQRDASAAEIRDQLHELRASWFPKATRAGDTGEGARAALQLIDEAEPVFADEEARDRYDLELRRSKSEAPASEEEPKIDWLFRGWNYYYTEDDGAARVAVRYARELEPKNPNTHVLSAWVNIRVATQEFVPGRGQQLRETAEMRQAKQDADEAYVLDELGEDTFDVHHVRGVVFYFMDNEEQALVSFDRALKAANDLEKSDTYVRKAWSHRAIAARNYGQGPDAREHRNQVLEQALLSLSYLTEQNTETVRKWATETAAEACTLIVENNFPDQNAKLAEYRALRVRLGEGSMPEGARLQLLAYLDLNIARLERSLAMEARERELNAVVAANGSQPGIPIIPLAIGLIVLVVGVQMQNFVPILLGLGVLAYGGFKIYQRVEWNKTASAYSEAQNELAAIEGERQRLASQGWPLDRPAPFRYQAF